MHAGQLDQAPLTGGQVAGRPVGQRRRCRTARCASSAALAIAPRSARRGAAGGATGCEPAMRGLAARARRSRARSACRTAPSAGTCGRGPAGPGPAAACAVTSSPKSCDRARGRASQAGAGVERRGLAGAVGADQAGDPARRARPASRPSTARMPPKRTDRSVDRQAAATIRVGAHACAPAPAAAGGERLRDGCAPAPASRTDRSALRSAERRSQAASGQRPALGQRGQDGEAAEDHRLPVGVGRLVDVGRDDGQHEGGDHAGRRTHPGRRRASTVEPGDEANGPKPMPETRCRPGRRTARRPARRRRPRRRTPGPGSPVTLVPCVASATGESAMARQSRPRRDRFSQNRPRATRTTTASDHVVVALVRAGWIRTALPDGAPSATPPAEHEARPEDHPLDEEPEPERGQGQEQARQPDGGHGHHHPDGNRGHAGQDEGHQPRQAEAVGEVGERRRPDGGEGGVAQRHLARRPHQQPQRQEDEDEDEGVGVHGQAGPRPSAVTRTSPPRTAIATGPRHLRCPSACAR